MSTTTALHHKRGLHNEHGRHGHTGDGIGTAAGRLPERLFKRSYTRIRQNRRTGGRLRYHGRCAKQERCLFYKHVCRRRKSIRNENERVRFSPDKTDKRPYIVRLLPAHREKARKMLRRTVSTNWTSTTANASCRQCWTSAKDTSTTYA